MCVFSLSCPLSCSVVRPVTRALANVNLLANRRTSSIEVPLFIWYVWWMNNKCPQHSSFTIINAYFIQNSSMNQYIIQTGVIPLHYAEWFVKTGIFFFFICASRLDQSSQRGDSEMQRWILRWSSCRQVKGSFRPVIFIIHDYLCTYIDTQHVWIRRHSTHTHVHTYTDEASEGEAHCWSQARYISTTLERKHVQWHIGESTVMNTHTERSVSHFIQLS